MVILWAIGVEYDFSRLDVFNALFDLVEDLRTVNGVSQVIDVTHIYNVELDTLNETFKVDPLVKEKPKTQADLDSLLLIIENLPFYEGLLWDKKRETSLIAVSIVDTFLNSERKTEVYDSIRVHTDKFAEAFDVELKYAGMPAIRVNTHKVIKVELAMFLIIALVVLAITLLFFFRSLYTVIFPMLVVITVIIWTLGFIGLFGYKISLVTGIIPALVTVISIPNCVYLITKYHIEYRISRNKMKALILVIEKIGIVTIMTNATTAVGLGVLAFTKIIPLHEFGVIAGLSVVSAFFISLLLIPILFSFLPPPSPKQTKHLDRKSLSFGIKMIDTLVHKHKREVYIVGFLLAATSIYGMTRILPIAYVVDDIPQDSQVLKDMRFMEERFNGVLPFEILIDTKRKNGVQRLPNLEKIDELQKRMMEYEDISRSISSTDLTMFMRQALYGGQKEAYDIPTRGEFNFIRSYLLNTNYETGNLSKNLTDSLMQKTRVSATIRDIGSMKMDILMDSLRADIAEIFDPEKFEITITGNHTHFHSRK